MAQKRRRNRGFHAKPAPVSTAGRPIHRPAASLGLIIVLAGIFAYSTSFAGVFVLDDVRAIVLNPTLQSLSSALAPPPQSTVSGRPVANLSFAISRAFGADPRPFHVFNLLVHLVGALLVFGCVRRTFLTARMRGRFGEGGSLLAFAVALIWVVHPLTTAAVTYVVQRVESLMSVFYLLTLYAAIRAAECSPERGRLSSSFDQKPMRWTVLAILSCAAGMATKEVMVTAPAAVALWMWVFAPAGGGRRALFGGLAATWIVFAVLVYHEHRAPSIASSASLAWRYLLTQSQVIVHYLRLAIEPSRLVFLYTWPLVTSVSEVAGPAALVVSLLAASLAGVLRRHPLGFAGAWFFLILAPTSSVIPIVTEVAAEHRMYLPLVPLIASAVAGFFILARRLLGDPKRGAWAAVAAAVVAAGAAAVETRARNLTYASEETLWRDTVAKDPANQRAHVAYGAALAASGRPAEAVREFEAAVALNPSDPVGHGRLGHLYGLQRNDAAAVEHLQRALELKPGDPVLTIELAGILADSREATVRNPARALPLAEDAVRLTGRRDAAALEVLAVAHAYSGHGAQAVALMEEAVEVARRTGDSRLIELEQRLTFYRSRVPAR